MEEDVSDRAEDDDVCRIQVGQPWVSVELLKYLCRAQARAYAYT